MAKIKVKIQFTDPFGKITLFETGSCLGFMLLDLIAGLCDYSEALQNTPECVEEILTKVKQGEA